MIQPSRFSFSAGALCLDFANTCGDRPVCAEELLTSLDDLEAWGVASGLISLNEMSGRSGGNDAADRSALEKALALRDAIYSVCSALAADGVPSTRDLETLNSMLREAMPNLEIGVRGDGCCWRWRSIASPSDRILWPVARSAAELLTSDDVERLRECAGEGCSWLFLDGSRNRLRKWCSMSSCGNRAKARRHYARKTADG